MITYLPHLKIWPLYLLIFCLSLQSKGLAHDTSNNDPTPKKVALLFLTYGDLPHSNFWKKYLIPHLDKFNLYIHPKSPLEDPFFSSFTISEICETSWANTVDAEQSLIKEAFANPDNYKFILLSNSCIPLVDAETLYQTLMKDNKSYFFWNHSGWWKPTDPREVLELPKKHRKGNQQWITLNRRHAEICALDTQVIDLIVRHPIDNESYPSCLFSVYHCLEEVVNFGYTFVDWNRPGGGGAHPYTFTDPTHDEDLDRLRQAREGGYLIARKFAADYPEEALKAFIEEGTKNQEK